MKRWILGIVSVLVAVGGLYATLLFFPQILIRHSVESGSLTIYHDGLPQDAVEKLASDVVARIGASSYWDTTHTRRVFYIQSQALYNLFARMSRVTTLAQGFALSATGNAFVSVPRVQALGQRSGRQPKFSIWEGSPAHTITHELAHIEVTNRIGRDVWSRLPEWKREGPPEYLANIGAIRADTGATLLRRIGTLNEDWTWRNEHGHDRMLYEAGLMVEFLVEVEGYSLDEIVDDAITMRSVRSAMRAWAAGT